MRRISSKTSPEMLVTIVVRKLREHDIEAALVGGAVVSIYTDNRYESQDLDFISSAEMKRIEHAMSELGFQKKGKDFVHPKTAFTVEFPTGPIGIGDDQPVAPEGSMTVGGVTIPMLSPTQSVMDRLAWFFYFDDRQCLDQAVWVVEKQQVSIDRVSAWARREGQEEKLRVFLSRLT